MERVGGVWWGVGSRVVRPVIGPWAGSEEGVREGGVERGGWGEGGWGGERGLGGVERGGWVGG